MSATWTAECHLMTGTGLCQHTILMVLVAHTIPYTMLCSWPDPMFSRVPRNRRATRSIEPRHHLVVRGGMYALEATVGDPAVTRQSLWPLASTEPLLSLVLVSQ